MKKGFGFTCAMGVLATLLGLVLVLPFVALFVDGGFLAISRGFECSLTWPALRLSLWTTTVSTGIVILGGTPLAWLLSRSRLRLARYFETFLHLPMVIPPAVGGIALLLTFGPEGMLGRWLVPLGFDPRYSPMAVVMAQTFVSAPFFIQAASQSFGRLEPGVLDRAREEGGTPTAIFWRVALPQAKPWLLSGAAMSWARALGEFGATLMFAGNLTGRTQTLPLAIYVALGLDVRTAQALSLLLVLVAFGLLLTLSRLNPVRPSMDERG